MASDCSILCFGKNFIVLRGVSKFSEGTSLSRDILFPEGKMFVYFLFNPREMPTVLDVLEGQDC